jgi:ketosteroid isomerase-like protein
VRTAVAVAALGSWLVLAGCQRQRNMAGAVTAVRDADLAFAKATKERGVDGWVEYFADSGVMIGPGHNWVGRAAIREVMAPELGDTTLSLTWRPVSAEVSASGDLGYTIGRWERSWRGKDSTATLRGTYVTIWRKQGDGTWKVVLDVGNADPPK